MLCLWPPVDPKFINSSSHKSQNQSKSSFCGMAGSLRYKRSIPLTSTYHPDTRKRLVSGTLFAPNSSTVQVQSQGSFVVWYTEVQFQRNPFIVPQHIIQTSWKGLFLTRYLPQIPKQFKLLLLKLISDFFL